MAVMIGGAKSENQAVAAIVSGYWWLAGHAGMDPYSSPRIASV